MSRRRKAHRKTKTCDGCGRDAAPGSLYCRDCQPHDLSSRKKSRNDGALPEPEEASLHDYLEKYHGGSEDRDFERDDI